MCEVNLRICGGQIGWAAAASPASPANSASTPTSTAADGHSSSRLPSQLVEYKILFFCVACLSLRLLPCGTNLEVSVS